MVTQADLTGDLRSALGPDSVLPSESCPEFAVDGVAPRAVVAPGSYEQAAAAMRYAHEQGLAVISWGGGTHMHVGNVPRRYDIALSLRRLDRVVEHEPADLTVTCQAGITLAALQERLAQAGQMLPLDPPHPEQATIGGVLAANASGPWRHAYGTARDFTIGMRVVTADGRITRAGGKVVKNVAGYDLCKLYIGSLGTLGVIVEATFKVQPLPKAQRTMAFGFASPAEAGAFVSAGHRRGLSLRAAQLLNPAAAAAAGLAGPIGRPALAVDLAGSPQAVERSAHEMRGLAGAVAARPIETEGGAAMWERISTLASPAGHSLVCRVSVLPSRLAALIQALESLGEGPRISGSPTAGALYASWSQNAHPEATLARLQATVSEQGGALVVEACPAELKGRIDVFGKPPPSFELMRRVKEQFDPAGVLSPGRFLGRL